MNDFYFLINHENAEGVERGDFRFFFWDQVNWKVFLFPFSHWTQSSLSPANDQKMKKKVA